jgi:hypothetical protein
MDILNWIYLKSKNLIKPTFNNSSTDLLALGANVGNSLFQVSSTNANSRAVHGILGTLFYYAYNSYYPGAYTDKVDAVIGAGLIPVDTAFTTV